VIVKEGQEDTSTFSWDLEMMVQACQINAGRKLD